VQSVSGAGPFDVTYNSAVDTCIGALACYAVPLQIGDGLLAHVAVYSRRLFGAEIESSMHCPGSVTAGLVGYWPLWDSSTQYDLSNNSNNGTNSGSAASSDGPPIGGCAGVN
jgi:hypothetical protein